MIKLMTTLLTIGTLAAAVMPAHAQGDDTAIIQDAQSTTVVTGDGNISTQVSDQTVRQRRVGRGNSNTGIVQSTDQVSDVYGSGNDTYMESTQRVEQRSRNNSRR